jgi:hypothetical protein
MDWQLATLAAAGCGIGYTLQAYFGDNQQLKSVRGTAMAGRRVIVTGSNTGIGLASAEELAVRPRHLHNANIARLAIIQIHAVLPSPLHVLSTCLLVHFVVSRLAQLTRPQRGIVTWLNSPPRGVATDSTHKTTTWLRHVRNRQ